MRKLKSKVEICKLPSTSGSPMCLSANLSQTAPRLFTMQVEITKWCINTLGMFHQLSTTQMAGWGVYL